MHEKGICHRDLKPDNIMIDPVAKKIKIIDFVVEYDNGLLITVLRLWVLLGKHLDPDDICSSTIVPTTSLY